MKQLFLVALAIFVQLQILANADEKYDIIVAADGSGDYTTIQAAIDACKAFRDTEQVIYVKNGTYHEQVLIYGYLTNIRLVGESAERTIITGSKHAGQPGVGTFNSYTLKVAGDSNTLENLSIENASGEVGQAVALHIEGDRCTVKSCRILGNQDTLYAAGQNSHQYFANCYIDGTTDFIFGAATAIFDDCTLHSKRNSYITAASTPAFKKFGYVFRNCELTAADSVTKVYLGRPWRAHAKVVFLNCNMGSHILPQAWHNWSKPEREETVFYAEYNSTGKGAKTDKRAAWAHQLTKEQADEYIQANIYSFSKNWKPISAK